MSFDLETIRNGYEKLVAEFGENGAAILAGVPVKFVESALNGEKPTYTESIENLLVSRPKALEFYKDEQLDLFKKMERFIIESGSAGKAAKALGQSGSTVSDIRNCKYKGDVQKIFSIIASHLTLKNEQRSLIYKGTDYVPTSVSEYMYQVIRGVHIAGECELITGDTGVGKSRTISKYASDYPENTIVVNASYAESSIIGILRAIAAQLGINGLNRLHDLNSAVLSRLHDGMLIIIDEAQHLKFPAVDHLRSLSDIFTDRGETMGVCFVGNPSFMRHFDDRKLPVTGQVFNRANLRPYVRAADVKLEDIKLLFPELVSQKKNAEIKFLYAVAQTNGECIRRAIKFYRTAYNMDGGNVSIERLAELAQTANLCIANIGNIIKRLREEAA